MTILFEDDHLLVVNKPPGVLAQPDRTGDEDVLRWGKRYLSDQTGRDDPFLGLVHRLDRPTSGIMVLARTSAAARHLSRQFRERTAQKQYVALVEGSLQGIGTWTDYVAKLGRQPTLVEPDHPEGGRAELDWQALASDNGRTLLQLQLHTGRPHQIRLQAAERGHPVLGDTRYGAASDGPNGAIALHHARLRVEHPETLRMETFVVDVPDEWTSVLARPERAAIDRMLARARPAE